VKGLPPVIPLPPPPKTPAALSHRNSDTQTTVMDRLILDGSDTNLLNVLFLLVESWRNQGLIRAKICTKILLKKMNGSSEDNDDDRRR
jgi:hypothetical protein